MLIRQNSLGPERSGSLAGARGRQPGERRGVQWSLEVDPLDIA